MLRVEEDRFAIFKIIILLGKKWDVISLNHLFFFFGLVNDIDLRQTL